MVRGQSEAAEWCLDGDVPEARLAVGSDPRCGWPVRAHGVAPVHFEFFWDGHSLWIADTYGVGHVSVDGRPVADWQQIQGPSQVLFGQAVMMVESAEEQRPDMAAVPEMVARVTVIGGRPGDGIPDEDDDGRTINEPTLLESKPPGPRLPRQGAPLADIDDEGPTRVASGSERAIGGRAGIGSPAVAGSPARGAGASRRQPGQPASAAAGLRPSGSLADVSEQAPTTVAVPSQRAPSGGPPARPGSGAVSAPATAGQRPSAGQNHWGGANQSGRPLVSGGARPAHSPSGEPSVLVDPQLTDGPRDPFASPALPGFAPAGGSQAMGGGRGPNPSGGPPLPGAVPPPGSGHGPAGASPLAPVPTVMRPRLGSEEAPLPDEPLEATRMVDSLNLGPPSGTAPLPPSGAFDLSGAPPSGSFPAAAPGASPVGTPVQQGTSPAQRSGGFAMVPGETDHGQGGGRGRKARKPRKQELPMRTWALIGVTVLAAVGLMFMPDAEDEPARGPAAGQHARGKRPPTKGGAQAQPGGGAGEGPEAVGPTEPAGSEPAAHKPPTQVQAGEQIVEAPDGDDVEAAAEQDADDLRRGAALVVAHRYRDALPIYEGLASRHPERTEIQAMVRVLRLKAEEAP